MTEQELLERILRTAQDIQNAIEQPETETGKAGKRLAADVLEWRKRQPESMTKQDLEEALLALNWLLHTSSGVHKQVRNDAIAVLKKHGRL